MSANLDLVRSIYADWERGDFSSSQWADPAIEYVQVGGLTPDPWTGLAGMAETMRGWLSGWEDFRIEADEFRELDGERVLVFAHYSGHGKTSGLEIGQVRITATTLLHVRNGEVTRLITYFDRDRALADLGLESANLDLVRSIYADWERGDFTKAEWAHPDIEWVSTEGPETGHATGLEGIAAAFRQWGAAWADFRIEAVEFIELGDERVLVTTHLRGRGKTSGIEVGKLPSKRAAVFYLRGGKVTRYVVYHDRDRALADLGLEE
jgi:ketosteroid isomerase-like protein